MSELQVLRARLATLESRIYGDRIFQTGQLEASDATLGRRVDQVRSQLARELDARPHVQDFLAKRERITPGYCEMQMKTRVLKPPFRDPFPLPPFGSLLQSPVDSLRDVLANETSALVSPEVLPVQSQLELIIDGLDEYKEVAGQLRQIEELQRVLDKPLLERELAG